MSLSLAGDDLILFRLPLDLYPLKQSLHGQTTSFMWFQYVYFVRFRFNTLQSGVPKPRGVFEYGCLSLSMVYICIPPPIIWLGFASERSCPLEFGGKKCSIFGEDLFLVFT